MANIQVMHPALESYKLLGMMEEFSFVSWEEKKIKI